MQVTTTFLLTAISAFLAIFIESANLLLQFKGRRLSRWLGQSAFRFHMIITGTFWIITFLLFAYLQLGKHPLFHNSDALKYTGLVLLLIGTVLIVWSISLLGLRRALCLNFFEDNVPVIRESLYKYLKNPLDYGIWSALFGFAIFSKSSYNLVIAVEFIIIMIPHIILENKPLNKRPLS